MMVESVLKSYPVNFDNAKVESLHGGLINTTWKVMTKDAAFILQKVNVNVFKAPQKIADNLLLMKSHLVGTKDLVFVSPISNQEGKLFTVAGESEYYRLFHFIEGSHTVAAVKSADQAYEAARQFGLFTKAFSGLDVNRLQITLPDFHNLTLRYEQLLQAQQSAGHERLEKAKEAINRLGSYNWVVERYEHIKSSPAFKMRVTHHDTKISNVLYDGANKGICVIDLDTVMPGYFISDVGDMMRTYLSEATEEERDFGKIVMRMDVFRAIADGYLEFMRKQLSREERDTFVYSGFFLTYMQALRFITDYLNNDVYYGAKYDGHNLIRGMNQLRLLEEMLIHREEMEAYVRR